MPWRRPGGRWGPQVAAWGVHLRTGYALQWRRWPMGSADDFELPNNCRLPRGGVVEGGAEIGFSRRSAKNNFWPPARKGKPGERQEK